MAHDVPYSCETGFLRELTIHAFHLLNLLYQAQLHKTRKHVKTGRWPLGLAH